MTPSDARRPREGSGVSESDGGDEEAFSFVSDLGQTLLDWSWEGTVGIEEEIERAAAAYGEEATASVTAESAIIQESGRTAILKGVPGLPPLAALPALKDLLLDVETGGLAAGPARERLRSLRGAAPLYPPSLRVLGAMVLAFAFAVDLVGTWEASIVALLTGAISGTLLLVAGRGPGWALGAPLLAAFFVSLVVFVAFEAGLVDEAPALLLIPALFVFIPGDSITMQAVELIDGRWSSSVARLYYSVMVLLLLGVGAYLALTVTGGGYELLNPDRPPEDFPWWAGYPGHVVFTVGVALTFQMRVKDIPLAIVVALVVTAIAQGGALLFGAITGTFLGAVALAVGGSYVARSPGRAPAFVWMITPFFILTPGSHGLRSVESLIGGESAAASAQVDALVINLLALALGIVVGLALAKPWRRQHPRGVPSV